MRYRRRQLAQRRHPRNTQEAVAGLQRLCLCGDHPQTEIGCDPDRNDANPGIDDAYFVCAGGGQKEADQGQRDANASENYHSRARQDACSNENDCRVKYGCSDGIIRNRIGDENACHRNTHRDQCQCRSWTAVIDHLEHCSPLSINLRAFSILPESTPLSG